jgi:Na+/glutamate symporter
MSRTSASIELQSYPQTPQTITQPPSIHPKDGKTQLLTEDLQPTDAPQNAVTAELLEEPDKKTTAIVLLTVVCVTMISSMLGGVVAVALPSIARELQLGPDVLLW